MVSTIIHLIEVRQDRWRLVHHPTNSPPNNPLRTRLLEIRHTCEESDGLTSYAYTQHDGRRYSSQNLVDGKINAKLNIKFLKNDKGDEWAVRITGEPLDGGEHHEFGWVELE